tara:strand:+ start:680 stop:805 length:126 start_codon:yes stop_codon:yes gene_type:complete
MIFVLNGEKIWGVGHKGMVRSAVCRHLKSYNFDILTIGFEE